MSFSSFVIKKLTSKNFHMDLLALLETLQVIGGSALCPQKELASFSSPTSPLSSNRQHYHIDVCLEDNREDY